MCLQWLKGVVMLPLVKGGRFVVPLVSGCWFVLPLVEMGCFVLPLAKWSWLASADGRELVCASTG